MKWGYSGFTRSETRGLLRDVKEKEYIDEAILAYEEEKEEIENEKLEEFVEFVDGLIDSLGE